MARWGDIHFRIPLLLYYGVELFRAYSGILSKSRLLYSAFYNNNGFRALDYVVEVIIRKLQKITARTGLQEKKEVAKILAIFVVSR